jgi:hypothetical protein
LSVFGPDLTPATEAGEWEWIPPALGEFGTVGGLVPRGYERYVRVDHGDDPDHDGWGLPPAVIAWMVALGAEHTTTPERSVFAIWEGWGWESSTIHYAVARRSKRFSIRRRTDPFGEVKDEFERHKANLSAELATLPKLAVTHRSYFLLEGPLSAVATIHDPIPPQGPHCPDLWWPADRAWFVGSDTDLAATILAGSVEFTQQIVEAWPDRARLVEPGDSLSYDA